MQDTLVEVLGGIHGQTMYTARWLRERVLWHLNPEACVGQVFLAEHATQGILGHTIVRRETVGAKAFGLFSTTYICPEFRQQSIAQALIQAGESWFLHHGLRHAATDTSDSNHKLISLFEGQGYSITYNETTIQMVRLEKDLCPVRSRPSSHNP